MVAELRVFCVGRDNSGSPTHDRFGVADLALDPVVGLVLKPSAQQRGNPRAGSPHKLSKGGGPFVCLICGDEVRVAEKRLRLLINRLSAAGESEVPLQALRLC